MDRNWGQELGQEQGTGTGNRNREQEQGTGTGNRNWGQEQEQELVREQAQGVLEIVERVGEEGRESFERKRLSAESALRAEF